jgi:hypothetical protein
MVFPPLVFQEETLPEGEGPVQLSSSLFSKNDPSSSVRIPCIRYFPISFLEKDSIVIVTLRPIL